MKIEKIQTTIRLDPDLYEKIKKDGEKEERNFRAQLEYIVKQYYEMKELLK